MCKSNELFSDEKPPGISDATLKSAIQQVVGGIMPRLEVVFEESSCSQTDTFIENEWWRIITHDGKFMGLLSTQFPTVAEPAGLEAAPNVTEPAEPPVPETASNVTEPDVPANTEMSQEMQEHDITEQENTSNNAAFASQLLALQGQIAKMEAESKKSSKGKRQEVKTLQM